MIAIVILGIGMLITSSMFPIAWFKARDVAEASTMPAIAEQAEISVKFLCRVNGEKGTADEAASSFFPGEFFFDTEVGGSLAGVLAAPYPDICVHALNLGNYGVGFVGVEPNPFQSSQNIPLADQPWLLEDSLQPWLSNSVYTGSGDYFDSMGIADARAAAHTRLFPPMEARPDPTLSVPAEITLWDEQFETRRYCWAVFYRFGSMVSADGNSLGNVGSCRLGITSACAAAKQETTDALGRSRQLTMYYITLKRPAGARYARQEGYVFGSGGGNWNPAKRLDSPRGQVGTANPLVLLPTPWRFAATLLRPPNPPATTYPVPPTGIPSEIGVNDVVLADLLQEETVIFDDRTGQVFRVTQRRQGGSPNSVVLTLDKEYTQREIYVADYVEFPPEDADPAKLGRSWMNFWEWRMQGCDDDPTDDKCKPSSSGGPGEDQPERRFYWVFPPPVESVDANGVPVFDGSPPVVGVEIRQLVLTP